MATVTIGNLCKDVATTLEDATGIKTVKPYDEVTEAISSTDTPRLHVYPDEFEPSPDQGTDRFTYKAAIQRQRLRIYIDHFPKPRSNLGDDLTRMVEGLDAIVDVLENQTEPPFFGNSAIKSFDWSWRRAMLLFGDARYLGGRFRLDLIIA